MRKLLRLCVTLAALLVGVQFVPQWWCSWRAAAWSEGQVALGRGVERWINEDLSEQDFATGDSKFDGEWLFATYMMAGMGFGQLARATHSSKEKRRYARLMDRCIERLTSRQLRRFDAEAWGEDALETLDRDGRDHAAYLGYLNVLLSHGRLLGSMSPKHAQLNDRVTRTLVRRLRRSRLLQLQSYPSEVFPVDNAAVVGSIGLYDRAVGADHSRLLARWGRRFRQRAVDPLSGLLRQQLDPRTGGPGDLPRGSGTSLSVYFLSFSHPRLSKELYRALRTNQATTLLGFGVVREYGPGHWGWGDIDSGPVLLGYGVSATGFSLGASRIHGDQAYFKRLASTLHLFGAPVRSGDSLEFVTGGPLGNALMLAMLTAQPRLMTAPAPARRGERLSGPY